MGKTMQKKILLLYAVLITLLAACSTSYQPLSRMGGGYQETFYAPDIVTVSFEGNKFTSYEKVNDFVMLRAAELALQNNYKYFEITFVKDLTTQRTTTSTGSSKTTETTTQKGKNTEVRTSRTEYEPPSTLVHEYPKILLEVKFHNSKPENVIVYESSFINNSIKTKYDIND
jgi:hypothetical protein